jgi:hypothetical protein
MFPDVILKHLMDMEDMVDLVQGPSLYELWKYYEKSQAILKLDLMEFKTSGAGGTLRALQCVESGSAQIPHWLNNYIKLVGDATNLFNVFEFNTTLALHMSRSQCHHQLPQCVMFIPLPLHEFSDLQHPQDSHLCIHLDAQ